MNFFDAFIYGIVQGISEFLPISSSGHLALLPSYLNIKSPGIGFDLAMHFGTFFATLIYFQKKIFNEVKATISEKKITPFSRNILLSTIMSIISIFLIKDFAINYRSPKVIAFNLIFFGVILYLADLRKVKSKEISLMEAILIGLTQSLSIFPGVSRSGITISTARYFNHSRQEAAHFSFFISLPILLAGIIYKLPDYLNSNNYDISHLLTGGITSFIIAFITIHFFLKLIAKTPLYIFSIYRLIVAILVIFSLII